MTMLLVPLAASTAAAADEARATFAYRAGSVASGTLVGSCEAQAVLFQDGLPGSLEFAAASATLESYVTDYNSTKIEPNADDPIETPLTVDQHRDVIDLPSGQGRVAWNETGRTRFFGANWPIPDPPVVVERFSVSFAATELRTGPLGNGLDAGKFPVEKWGTVWTYLGGVPGWNRWLEVEDGPVVARGNLTIHVRAAHIETDGGFQRTLPAARENVTVVETEVVGYYHVRLHHALLRLTYAQIELDSRAVRVACGSMTAQVEGTLVAYGSAGRVEKEERAVEFGERELSLEGKFDLDERVEDDYPDGSGEVSARGVGAFSVVGLDFVDTGLMDSTLPIPLEAGLWSIAIAIVAAAATYLAKVGGPLFTRLDKPRVVAQRTRATVLEVLASAPWITAGRLHEKTGVSRSALRYQLNVLQRHGARRRQAKRAVPAVFHGRKWRAAAGGPRRRNPPREDGRRPRAIVRRDAGTHG